MGDTQDLIRSGELTLGEKATNSDTWAHIHKVQDIMLDIIYELQIRALNHDQSKLELPEVEIFTEYTPKLESVTYGSAKYKHYLKEMGVALDHHYNQNRHHPEYYSDGINDMTLVDLVEMLCDWRAATLRHNDGDIIKSLEHNKGRFKIGEQLYRIFRNTITQYFR